MSDKPASGRGLRKFFDHVRTTKIQLFYDEYYARAQESQAHSEFCRLAYGHDLCQHGMLDMRQLDRLLEVARLRPGSLVLELGCGAGFMAEYVSDRTGCRIVGIDISSAAIERARARTHGKRERLTFEAMDMEKLDYPEHHFDAVISIDTLYYVDGLENALKRVASVVKPGATMCLFYHVDPDAAGADPARDSHLAVALGELDLAYRVIDLTAENREHWELRREVLLGLKDRFEEEGNTFLWETRMDEYSQGFGEYHRFLYVVGGREDGAP
jgi:ubiquinone/menaquinone biosynthesis C-methylase UbiE